MPTVYFIFYVLAVAGAYIFRLGYLGWFGAFFFYSVAIMPVFILLLSLPGMLRAKMSLSIPYTAVCGSDVQLCINIRTGLLPLGRLTAALQIRNIYTGETTRQRLRWNNLSGGTLYIPVSGSDCGKFVCEISNFRCCDLLRLVSIRRKAPAPVSCVIMPSAAAPDGLRDISAELEARTVLKPKHGGGYAEEHELREYRPGDMVNSIHWKLSSKTDKVIVREPLTSQDAKIYIVVTGQSNKALGSARYISENLCELEQEHELLCPSVEVTVGNSQESAAAFMELLSKPRSSAAVSAKADARCCFIVSDEGVIVK